MKKIISILLVLLVLTGCGIKGGNLEDINKRGYIVVAMEGGWAPWTYHDENGDLAGYDVEVGKYIADYLGVEVRYAESGWDSLLAGVEAGRYDMMINGCDITEERQQVYDFSVSYGNDRIVVITRSDYDEIHSLEDLQGKKTANSTGSTYAQIAEEYGATVSSLEAIDETFEALGRGTIDATLNGEPSYYYYMKMNPGAQYKIACNVEEVPQIGVVMKKGSTELVKKVNEAINAAKADGTLTALSIKYFGSDITQ